MSFLRPRGGFSAAATESPASQTFATETGDPLLLTPGPLTTSTSVKAAMMHDYGSRDPTFIAVTARVRQQILEVLDGDKALSPHAP